MRSYTYIFFVLLCTLFITCKSDDTVVLTSDTEIQAWLDTAGIQATRDDNTEIFYYQNQSNPSGDLATQGDVAGIYYNLFDLEDNLLSSYQAASGDPLLFKVGASAVFPIGVDFGVGLMRTGEIYTFILPPAQGYGALQSQVLSNALIARIEIELVSLSQESILYTAEETAIRNYVDDNLLDSLRLNPVDSTDFLPSGIAFKRRSRGVEGIPANGDTISVNYSGRFINNDSFVGQSSLTWIYGSDVPRALVSGFEESVSRMLVNEQALALIPSSQGYRESALIIPDFISEDVVASQIAPDYVLLVPPYSTLLFEITRVD